MSSDWTIDSIAHALPHPDLRAAFMREVNFTEVSQLPAILERWQRLVEDFDAGRPHITRLADHYREHGELPAKYEGALVDLTEEIADEARSARRGAA